MQATGERFISDETWGYRSEIEHRHRYNILKDILAGKKVLDAACGTGYGTYTLSQWANHVTGIDISAEAIDFCRENYQNRNLSYLQMSVADMKFEDQSFDVIISFETLEHIPYELQCDFLKEVTRVLKDNGVLIMSTPDRIMATIAKRGNINPYHIHEFTTEEYRTFLMSYFPHVKFAAQNLVEMSVISPESEPKGAYDIMFSKHYEGILPSLFVIGICSKDKKAFDAANLKGLYMPCIAQYFHEKYDLFTKSCLYRDLGNGFTEKDKLEAKIILNGKNFHVKYVFENNNSQIVRFDTCERCCRIDNFKIISNCNAKITWTNAAICKNDTYIFCTPDPIFELKLENSLQETLFIEFTGEINALSEMETYQLIKSIPASESSYIETLDTQCVCYYDTGNGFNETEKTYSLYEKLRGGGIFSTYFNLPPNTKKFRIDPCLTGNLPVSYEYIKINSKRVDYEERNIVEINGKRCFCNRNPHFIFHFTETEIHIEIKLNSLNTEDFASYLKSQ